MGVCHIPSFGQSKIFGVPTGTYSGRNQCRRIPDAQISTIHSYSTERAASLVVILDAGDKAAFVVLSSVAKPELWQLNPSLS